MARPRVFDIEKAIQTATVMFWKNGYEQTSLANLTEEMGITPPSFYFAFESKDGLFRKVVKHYVTTYLGFMAEAFRQPTARGVAETMLYGCADVYSNPANPRGCLIMNCSLPSSETAVQVRQELASERKARRAKLKRHFQAAIASGDLPRDSDPEELARYVMSIGWGLAVEAQSGASKRDLYRIVARAMQAWPT
ncbi:TetR/AcrR family transcriptional regulator [Granulicella mallensis]|uniref:Regulatory protein TetR n=1 Tax=Granulicella mallensis (strain ATCC BAA-1857 / DSM 23137 / MP5ACTX8) TaxID=682795 RepID=G8P134_GRAMM|nr:TetR/AcrR family transcriptional regulator [Granulicella mallensis]AEU36958.1 regulatory protein TetR [Granulicella mallensis MP5ACTX8]